MAVEDKTDLLRAQPLFATLKADSLTALAAAAEWRELSAGEVVLVEGTDADTFAIVASGLLQAVIDRGAPREMVVGVLRPGDVMGETSLVGHGKRNATVVAHTDSLILELARDDFDELLREHGEIIDAVAQVMVDRSQQARLHSLLGQLVDDQSADLNELVELAEWVRLSSGELLYQAGAQADSLFIVVDGWLAEYVQDGRAGETALAHELKRGDPLGLHELTLGSEYRGTARALRDSVLVRYCRDDFERLSRDWPQFMMALTRKVFRLSGTKRAKPDSFPTLKLGLTPVHSAVDLDATALELRAAFERIGASVRLFDSSDAARELGVRQLADLDARNPNWARVALWLERQHGQVEILLLKADPRPSTWNERIAARCDLLLAVADGAAKPERGYVKAQLRRGRLPSQGRVAEPALARDERQPARRALLCVQPEGTRMPRGTRRWCDAVGPERVFHMMHGRSADLDRAARLLSGRGLGLVLGGGGARGFAHLGVARALQEQGVTPDFIGGTSIGAIIGAQLATGMSLDQVVALNRRCIEIGAFKEYTLPLVSFLSSRKIDQLAKMVSSDYDIEDLWVPYFAISSDLTNARMVVHERGPIWKAIRASSSLPGIILPVIERGALLVDGALMNNLPADVMREKLGESATVVGVSVSPEREFYMQGDRFPDPWRFLARIVLGRRDPAVPTIVDVLMRSMLLSSVDRMDKTRRHLDLLIQPDVKSFAILNFERLEDIVESGYRAALASRSQLQEIIGRYTYR